MDFIIRKATPKDAEAIRLFLNREIKNKSTPMIGSDKPKPKKWSISAAKGYKTGQYIAFVAEINGKIIGDVGCEIRKCRMSHVGSCGWTVASDCRGKGVCSALMQATIVEARKKGLVRLEAEIVPENTASVALAKKFGFELEGRKRKAFKTDDGKYHDLLVVGKLL